MKAILPLFLALTIVGFLPASVRATDEQISVPLQQIQDEWAEAFYHQPESTQIQIFKALLPRVRDLKQNHPQRAEPLIVEAVILCTYAAADWGLSTLGRLNDARQLLIDSIDRDPKAMEASAYITLGNLYYRLPGWPISFGDNAQALVYLEAARRMYPEALDANYFLGDYWLQEGDYVRALEYLTQANKAPIRATQRLSDEKIKEQLAAALIAAKKHETAHSDFFSGLLHFLDEPKAQ